MVNQYPGESRLYIKLAERLISLDPGIESYLKRPPLIEDLCLIDDRGEMLDFETTSFAEMLEFQTRLGLFGMAFQDPNTLTFGLPPNTSCGLRFHVQTKMYLAACSSGESKQIRDVACETNGKVIKNKVSMTQTGRKVEFIVQAGEDCAITLHISGDDDLAHQVQPFSVVRSNAEKRWNQWFDRTPPVSEKYRQKYACAWWVMGNNLISPLGCINREAMMPTKSFYVGIWLWDSALHAIAFRHADPELARDQLRVILAHQLSDGMLPDAIFDEGVVSEIDHPFSGRVTKPPILAWAALKIHESDPNPDFLEEIYPALVRCLDWWFSQKDGTMKELITYTHPYSSGLDNSPLWDHGMPTVSPDINTYLYVKMTSLARIAEVIGRHEESLQWSQRAAAHLRDMIAGLWDEKKGLFRSLHNGKPIPVLTPFQLYPLWTGALSDEMTQRLVAHLKDPHEFEGRYMIPTVARNDPAYNPEAMWRGPAWANINYFFVEALQKAGEIELARALREKTLNMIMDQPGIHEYYNPETGQPPVSSAGMFGWTAAVFIDLAIQATADENSAI